MVLLPWLLAACSDARDREPPDLCESPASTTQRYAAAADDPGKRVAPASLRFGVDTGAIDDLALIDAFPGLAFTAPVDVAGVPGGTHNVVVEHSGRILIFENDPAVARAEVFLDIAGRVRHDGSEQGLIRIAFDPGYAGNGYVYVTYSGRSSVDAQLCAEQCSVVSRFTRSAGNPLRLDPGSEQIVFILPQPGIWHNVGNLTFGPDGYLYIGVGDGGELLDPDANAQNRTNLFGSVLRIDVSGGLPYRIPPDNPFAGIGLEQAGVPGTGEPVRQEIWAYGFRNPHRFSIDPVTREMWLGDVGQATAEEIDFVVKGGNYGWPAFEGTTDWGRSDIGRNRSQYRFPSLEYGREDGGSVTGGHVYRGNALPALHGQYLFADFVSGTIWAAERPGSGWLGEKRALASAGGLSVAAIGLIGDEPYFVNMSAGIVQKFDTDGCETCEPPPALLSQTGIFTDLATLEVTPGLTPYEVIAPLWSDGTDKSRWLALPADAVIGFDAVDAWTFPPGTVLVKHFAIDLDQTGACDMRRNLETRVLVLTRSGWIGYTYRWNEAQTDAELLSGSRSETLTLQTDAGPRTQIYTYPSSSDCAICHNATADHVLGVRTQQINREVDDGDTTENQLTAMSRIGLFDRELADPQSYGRYADPYDAQADLRLRAKSYLASNCAQCHNPDSAIPAAIDLRFETDDAQMRAIGVAPGGSDMGVTDGLIIAPGDHARSTLWLRLATRDEGRMPPLASHVVDEPALTMIGEWIDAMPQ